MAILLKLGGSLITDKTKPRTFRKDVLSQIVKEIQDLTQKYPNIQWIIGHGSGSFGHVEAHKYSTINGVISLEQWLGFTKVSHAASQLSQLVLTEFVDADLPVIRLQPSASMVSNDGVVEQFDINILKHALDRSLIPLVHGDVSFDVKRGGTIISTESLFQYLIQHVPIQKIILLGEVDGVFDSSGNVISHITPLSFADIAENLKGASGVDVTGGMYQKVYDMLEVVKAYPSLQTIIANGKTPNVLQQILTNQHLIGTTIAIK